MYLHLKHCLTDKNMSMSQIQNEVAIQCSAVNYPEECRAGQQRKRKQDCIIVMITLLARGLRLAQ